MALMDGRIERIRRESDRNPGRHYSAAVKQAALEVVHAGLADGRSLSWLAGELKITTQTLRKWLSSSPKAFRRVQITQAPVPATRSRVTPSRVRDLSVITARGHRVEGLDLADVIAVLRALEGPA